MYWYDGGNRLPNDLAPKELLPESGEESAMGLARRVMQRVAAEEWENEPLTISEESRCLAWIPLAGIASLNREKSIMRMVEKMSDIIAA